MGGINKYSFHKSGICRSAFTKEHGTPSKMSDRKMFKWIRAETPPVTKGQATRVALIAFPTNFLSRSLKGIEKSTTWIPAAPHGGATYLELAYTCESENTVLSAFQSNARNLITYQPLPSGEAFFISYHHADWENKDLRIPAAKDKGSIFPDLLFSERDPRDTGRPIRIRFGPYPKNGDDLVLQELGGYEDKTTSV